MATYPIKMLRDEDRQAFVPFTNAAAVVDKDNKTLQELMDNGKYKIQNNVTTASAGKGVLDAYQGKVLNDKFNNYVPLSQKGVANGVASLDSEGKVPSAQLPSYVDDVIESYIVSGSTALSSGWLSKTEGGAALTPEKGKIYLIMTSGSYQNKQYRWGGSTYVLCNPSDVNSVNGMTGVVTLKTLTIQKNGTQVGDTFNGTTDEVINITVPTNNNQLTNGAGYITSAGSITGNAATATKATQDGDGNVITSTYLPLAGGTLSGAVAFGTSSTTSAPTTGIQVHDIRNATITPSSMGDRNANFYFFQYDGWKSIMRVKGWNGSYTTWELCGPADTSANDTLRFRSGVGDTWRNWKTIAFTDSNITGNAATATSATKATQDGDGKTISSTYLKLTGGKLSGPLSFASGQPITWADGTYQQRLNIVDDSNANTNVFEFQQSTDSGSTFTTLAAIKDNGQVVATTFVGNLSGNATSASKTTGALTIQKNGTTVQTFDGSSAITANITVPTKTSELTNDSNFIKNTTYASATTAGVVKLGTGLAIADGVLSVTGAATAESVEWSVVKNKPTAVSYWTNDSGYITRSNTMSGATSTTAGAAGTVPAPAAGKEAQFLRGDGTWAVPSKATSADSATTATKATQDGNGKVIADTYVPFTGGTMTGALNFKNTTQNKFGDDVAVGDFDKGGQLGIIGLNGSTGIRLLAKGGSWNVSTAGVSLVYNETDKCLEFQFI